MQLYHIGVDTIEYRHQAFRRIIYSLALRLRRTGRGLLSGHLHALCICLVAVPVGAGGRKETSLGLGFLLGEGEAVAPEGMAHVGHLIALNVKPLTHLPALMIGPYPTTRHAAAHQAEVETVLVDKLVVSLSGGVAHALGGYAEDDAGTAVPKKDVDGLGKIEEALGPASAAGTLGEFANSFVEVVLIDVGIGSHFVGFYCVPNSVEFFR